MSAVLITGFGDYGDEVDNPSGLIAAHLDGVVVDGVSLRGQVLPVGTHRVGPALSDAIERSRPDVVVITGVTRGRVAPALERVALNVRDFPIPDIDGLEPVDEPVVEGGPDAYLSTLPVKAILARWHHEGLPGYISNSAGTYVCNQTFYLARHLTHGTATITGLVHIPVAQSTAAGAVPPPPSLPLDVLERAVQLAAVVAATHRGADLRLGAGTTC